MVMINAVRTDVPSSAELQRSLSSSLDHQDHQVHQDHQDLQDQVVPPVVQVESDHQDPQEIQDQEAKKDPKADPDPQDLLGPALKLDQPSSWSVQFPMPTLKNVHQVLSRSADPTKNAVEENSAASMDATWLA